MKAQAGLKNAKLFENGVKSAWDWAKPSEYIRWFTDGERRYGVELWELASVYIKPDEAKGLEVAIKVKGSQGKTHVEWIKQEHRFTHNEAQNIALIKKGK
jgi:hypothetical protein